MRRFEIIGGAVGNATKTRQGEVDGKIERRVAMAPAEQLEVWTERVSAAAWRQLTRQ